MGIVLTEYSEMEERILRAALKVVNECTISGTRMHLIADRADMVQSNVHYYYKTKNDLLIALQAYVENEFYTVRLNDRKKAGDNLRDQLDVFFRQKKAMLGKRREFDFAELDFIVQTRINRVIREYFQENFTNWRDEIREIIIRYCPEMPDEDREIIPYLVVSLLEGASIQFTIDPRDFDVDAYMDAAERMVLDRIAAVSGK